MNSAELLDIFYGNISGDGGRLYEPMRIEGFRRAEPDRKSQNVDATFQLVWKGQSIPFLAEVTSRSVPRLVRRAIFQHRDLLQSHDESWHRVVIGPHLSDGIVGELQRAEVSGLDLNGNYLILTPKLLAIRLDRPNQYPESRPIKNIYSNKSSLVGRFLLAEARTFQQVNEIYRGIRDREGDLSLSTVSKVLSRLDEELLIEKRRGKIRILQPEKLLDHLRDGYSPPDLIDTMNLKLPDNSREQILCEVFGDDWMWSGESSAPNYTTTTPPTVDLAYTDLSIPKAKLEEFESRRFYNCTIARTHDSYVYFDRRDRWASPIETYLALSRLDKRERQVARTIRETTILSRYGDDV